MLTLGTIEALRAVGQAVTLLAPPDLTLFLESEGVAVLRDRVPDPGSFIRGSAEAIDAFVDRLYDDGDLALGVLGNPLSDFAGLPVLLRALERRGIECELVPGMPRATLQASMAMPLIALPPGSEHHSWDDLVGVMARLRRSCPWDREQTHRSLVPFLIEEAYEVVEEIEREHDAELCDELGDLLLQVVFHAQLATERGKFSIADVVDAIANKMIRRHPHVFGDHAVSGVAEVWQNWEQLKSQEPSGQKRESRLDGIPVALGALQRGQRMQEKASRVGFDWPNAAAVIDKITEELAELAEARASSTTERLADDAHVREELGDVLFTVVNFARRLGIDAESALREANDKFYRRFRSMEEQAGAAGRKLGDVSSDELEALWREAKAS